MAAADSVLIEVAPFTPMDHLELTALSHSSQTSSPALSNVPSPILSPNTTPASPMPSSNPCPQPSPLSANLATTSLLEPSLFSLDSLSSTTPSPATNTRARSDALTSHSLRRLLFADGTSLFAPIAHHLGWARRLFWVLSHPLLLLSASLLMAAVHVLLLYMACYTMYLLHTTSPSLSALPTFVFTLFVSFLIVRSLMSLAMLTLRVNTPQLWYNLPPASASRLSRYFYPTHLLLRVLSLLFLLMATAALIFGTPLNLSSRPLLLVFILLSYDAITLSIPLLLVPSLAFLLPLHSLHMSFPYIPLTPPHPPLPSPGMSASQLSQLGESVWSGVGGVCESEEVCAVCLCELESGERIRKLPKCSHVFHVGCIDQWLMKRAKCPLCVQPVDAGRMAVSSSPAV